jgi:hypothetical protein
MHRIFGTEFLAFQTGQTALQWLLPSLSGDSLRKGYDDGYSLGWR